MQLTKALAVGVLTLFAGLAASSTATADVQLTIQNGRVTLIAKDATLRQILAEWAKVGQAKVVNGDRVPGPPQIPLLTLQLTDVPELQALDILLRPLSGYVAAPRATTVANLSQFDRILVMPTVAPAVTAVMSNAAPPPAFPQPGPPGMFPQPGQQVIDEDDAPTPNRGPVFNTFPPPQVANPMMQGIPSQTPGGVVAPAPGPLMMPQPIAPATGSPTPYSNTPNVPFGTSVPGMIVPAPQQPGQPAPIAPPKRPGGN